jgi:hypothetical protein
VSHGVKYRDRRCSWFGVQGHCFGESKVKAMDLGPWI